MNLVLWLLLWLGTLSLSLWHLWTLNQGHACLLPSSGCRVPVPCAYACCLYMCSPSVYSYTHGLVTIHIHDKEKTVGRRAEEKERAQFAIAATTANNQYCSFPL